MKHLKYLTMCLLAVVLAVSCSRSDSGNSLTGKWQQTVTEDGTMAVSTYDFKDNGKLTQTLTMKSETPAIEIDAEGTCDYVYTGDTITFKFSATDFNFKKFMIEGVGEDIIETAMDHMKAEMTNVEQRFTDVRIEGDELTATFEGQEVTFQRIAD